MTDHEQQEGGQQMSWLEMMVACWLTRRLVKQGRHKKRITELFMVLRAQVEREFTEDNYASHKALMYACVADAMDEG